MADTEARFSLWEQPADGTGEPRLLWGKDALTDAIPDRVRAGSPVRGTFAITPDDQRFLMVRDKSWGDMAGTPTMVVVNNFFEELRAKLKK